MIAPSVSCAPSDPGNDLSLAKLRSTIADLANLAKKIEEADEELRDREEDLLQLEATLQEIRHGSCMKLNLARAQMQRATDAGRRAKVALGPCKSIMECSKEEEAEAEVEAQEEPARGRCRPSVSGNDLLAIVALIAAIGMEKTLLRKSWAAMSPSGCAPAEARELAGAWGMPTSSIGGRNVAAARSETNRGIATPSRMSAPLRKQIPLWVPAARPGPLLGNVAASAPQHPIVVCAPPPPPIVTAMQGSGRVCVQPPPASGVLSPELRSRSGVRVLARAIGSLTPAPPQLVRPGGAGVDARAARSPPPWPQGQPMRATIGSCRPWSLPLQQCQPHMRPSAHFVGASCTTFRWCASPVMRERSASPQSRSCTGGDILANIKTVRV